MAEETIASSGWSPTDADPLEGGRIWSLPPGTEFVRDTFTVGDLVELRSGGPAMTVSIVADEAMHVEWFFNGELQFAEFPRQMLQGLSPDPLAEARSEWRNELNQAHLRAEREEAERHGKDFAMTKALVVGFLGGFLTAVIFGWLQ